MVDDPIEAYLDRLLVVLKGQPREIRRTLAEAELHLYDSAADLEAAGLSPEEAREEAVRRMGPVEAAAEPPKVTLRLTAPLRRRAALSLLLIGGVAGVAIGIAGVLGLAVRTLWGPAAIANGFPAGSFSAEDCREWQAAQPHAHGCLNAMFATHAGHYVADTLGCGALGLLLLALYAARRRRWALPGRLGELFAIELLIGAALSAIVAAIFFLRGLQTALVTHDHGVGQPFCLAIGATLAFAFFVARARRCGVTATLGPTPRRLRGLSP